MNLRTVTQRADRLTRRTGPAAVVCAESATLRRGRHPRRWTPESWVDEPGGPMEERRPRDPGRPLTAAELTQRRADEEYLARELAMWHVLVWLPEARAERMMWLALVLRRVRAELLAAGLRRFLPGLAELHRGPPDWLSLDHLITAPRTGPPAGAVAVGARFPGAFLPFDRTGGAVVVP